jgi:tetratricopeptide (TPR) repeat protein
MKKWGRLGLMLGVMSLTGTVGCEKEDPAKEFRAKGSDHLSKKEFRQALEQYEQALKVNPDQEKVWKEKAFAHIQLSQHEEGAKALQKYMEYRKDPAERLELTQSIADQLQKAGKLDEAKAELLKLMETKKDAVEKSELQRTIAEMYRKSGDLDNAENAFNEAVKINPKDEASLGWLGAIYAKRGGVEGKDTPAVPEHLDKALQYYDQVIALNPAYPFTYINKRIVMAKYAMHEQKQAQVADAESKVTKNKAKAAELAAKAQEHQKRAQEFQKQFDELTQKFTEAQKAAKAKAAEAAAAAQAAPPTK